MQYTHFLPVTVALLAALPVSAAEKPPSGGAQLSIVAPAESRTVQIKVPTGSGQTQAKLAESKPSSMPAGSQLKVVLPSTDMDGWVEPARAPELGRSERREMRVVDSSRQPAIIVADQKPVAARKLTSEIRIAGTPEREQIDRRLLAAETIVVSPAPRMAQSRGPRVAPIASPVEPEATVAIPKRTLRLAPSPPQEDELSDVPKVVVVDHDPQANPEGRSTATLSPHVKLASEPANRRVATARSSVQPTAEPPSDTNVAVVEPAVPVEAVEPHPMSAERAVTMARRQAQPVSPTPAMPEPQPELAMPAEPVMALEPEPMPMVAEQPRANTRRRSNAPRTSAPRYPAPVVYKAPAWPQPSVYRGYSVPGRGPVPFAGRGIPAERSYPSSPGGPRLTPAPPMPASVAQQRQQPRAQHQVTADRTAGQPTLRRN